MAVHWRLVSIALLGKREPSLVRNVPLFIRLVVLRNVV